MPGPESAPAWVDVRASGSIPPWESALVVKPGRRVFWISATPCQIQATRPRSCCRDGAFSAALAGDARGTRRNRDRTVLRNQTLRVMSGPPCKATSAPPHHEVAGGLHL